MTVPLAGLLAECAGTLLQHECIGTDPAVCKIANSDDTWRDAPGVCEPGLWKPAPPALKLLALQSNPCTQTASACD